MGCESINRRLHKATLLKTLQVNVKINERLLCASGLRSSRPNAAAYLTTVHAFLSPGLSRSSLGKPKVAQPKCRLHCCATVFPGYP